MIFADWSNKRTMKNNISYSLVWNYYTNIFIQFNLKNGGLGTMSVTMLTYPKNLEGSVTILGEKGTVKIGGTAVNEIEEWKFEDTKDDDKLIKNASYKVENVYGFGHKNYYQNVIDTFRGHSEPLCDGEEGLKSLELIIAAYLSSKQNIFVKLPLKSWI